VDGYTLRSYAVTFLVLVLASTTLGLRAWGRLSDRAQKILTPVLMALGLVLSTAYLVDGSYNPFLYFRF
jgi:alginate O-acetyltransferase complex protein AlgI